MLCKVATGKTVALPLGQSLLYTAIHYERHCDLEISLLPSRLAERIISACKAAVGPFEDMGCDNVIVKIPVVPQGSGDQVIMVELGEDNKEEGDGAQTDIPSTSDLYLYSQAILSQQHSLRGRHKRQRQRFSIRFMIRRHSF